MKIPPSGDTIATIVDTAAIANTVMKATISKAGLFVDKKFLSDFEW